MSPGSFGGLSGGKGPGNTSENLFKWQGAACPSYYYRSISQGEEVVRLVTGHSVVENIQYSRRTQELACE